MPRGVPDIDWRKRAPCKRCGSRTSEPHACDSILRREYERVAFEWQQGVLDAETAIRQICEIQQSS